MATARKSVVKGLIKLNFKKVEFGTVTLRGWIQSEDFRPFIGDSHISGVRAVPFHTNARYLAEGTQVSLDQPKYMTEEGRDNAVVDGWSKVPKSLRQGTAASIHRLLNGLDPSIDWTKAEFIGVSFNIVKTGKAMSHLVEVVYEDEEKAESKGEDIVCTLD